MDDTVTVRPDAMRVRAIYLHEFTTGSSIAGLAKLMGKSTKVHVDVDETSENWRMLCFPRMEI